MGTYLGYGKLAAALLAAVCVVTYSTAAQAVISTRGDVAPEISGRSLDGQTVALSDYRGKWVFVDFWASWCHPCMRLIPSVVNLSHELSRNPNFAVLGVSLDSQSTLSDLKRAVKSNGITYPVLYCGDGCNLITSDWRVNAIPATFLIDPDGRIVGRDIPVGQVKQLIEQNDVQPDASAPAPGTGIKNVSRQPSGTLIAPGVRPTQVTCTDRLLPVSMSSGLDGGRDLEITLALRQGLPKLSKYRLFVRATERLHGRTVEANWRYDINVYLDPGSVRAPFYVEIKDTSDAAKTGGLLAPQLTAAIDLRAKTCVFTVPLDPQTQKLNYAVAFYDDLAFASGSR